MFFVLYILFRKSLTELKVHLYSRKLSWPGSDGCCRSFGLFGHDLKVFLPSILPVSVAGIFRGQELELCLCSGAVCGIVEYS